ncbi:YfdX family protein [Endothiovibrio diazotrophicus]
MTHHLQRKTLVIAVLTALSLSGPAFAGQNVNEEVKVLPGHQVSPRDEVAISSAAVKVLRHIAAARGNLAEDKPDLDQAKEELAQSRKLLEIITAGLPTTKVKDHIWVAKKHLEYEDTEEVLPDLVPIYSSLDELVDYVPTAQAKDHVDQAKQALKKGDKSQAVEQLKAADDALVYVEADLPLAATRDRIAEAGQALEKGDAKAAGEALARAEQSVVFVSVTFDSPLTRAKAALWRARQEHEQGEDELAKADLNAGVNYLEQAAKSDDPVTRDAATRLVGQVRDLHAAIDQGDKDFGTRLEGVWHRVSALSERTVERISTGWQRIRAERAGKTELIEAKLQLAYARIDHLDSGDDAAAKVDLAAAKAHLDDALKQLGDEPRAEAKKIADGVDRLSQAVEAGNAEKLGPMQFARVENGLGRLIRQM